MGLLPMDIDILPASDDRIFKLILTSPEEGKTVLMDLISSIIKRQVVDVVVRNNERQQGRKGAGYLPQPQDVPV